MPLSYNAAKQNKFVPYRVEAFPPPRKFGDLGEFLIKGEWLVCEFGGDEWMAEAKVVGCGSQQNRSWVTNPELHREASKKGMESPDSIFSRGLTFATNGCHSPELQSKRVKGKKWWWNPKTKTGTRSETCPGEGWVEQRDPSIDTAHTKGRRRYQNTLTGQRKLLKDPPDDTWVLGWGISELKDLTVDNQA